MSRDSGTSNDLDSTLVLSVALLREMRLSSLSLTTVSMWNSLRVRQASCWFFVWNGTADFHTAPKGIIKSRRHGARVLRSGMASVSPCLRVRQASCWFFVWNGNADFHTAPKGIIKPRRHGARVLRSKKASVSPCEK